MRLTRITPTSIAKMRQAETDRRISRLWYAIQLTKDGQHLEMIGPFETDTDAEQWTADVDPNADYQWVICQPLDPPRRIDARQSQ